MSILHEFFVSPFEEFYKYRELIWYNLKAELKRRHFRKILGPLWWVGEPLSLAGIFVFVTTFLFKNAFGEHHVATVIVSVLVWHWLAKSVTGAPNILLGFRKELSSTNLPIYPLIFSNIMTHLMTFGFSLVVIFITLIISGVEFTSNIAYLPLLIIIQFTIIVGTVTNLARAGIFFRDLSPVVTAAMGILFFASPIIYQRFTIPEEYQIWFSINPLGTLLPAWRDVLIYGNSPDLAMLGLWFLVFLFVAFVGFKRLSQSRADFYKRL